MLQLSEKGVHGWRAMARLDACRKLRQKIDSGSDLEFACVAYGTGFSLEEIGSVLNCRPATVFRKIREDPALYATLKDRRIKNKAAVGAARNGNFVQKGK